MPISQEARYVLLLLRQLVDVHAHAGELEARDFFIDGGLCIDSVFLEISHRRRSNGFHGSGVARREWVLAMWLSADQT